MLVLLQHWFRRLHYPIERQTRAEHEKPKCRVPSANYYIGIEREQLYVCTLLPFRERSFIVFVNMFGSTKKPGFESPKGTVALVTGSSGFVGARLVEMLLERGTKTVVAFDVMAPSETLSLRFAKVQEETRGKIIVLSQSEGDLCSDAAVTAAFQKVPKIDVVYHIAALVGPFHSVEKYEEVNFKGTLRIIEHCKTFKVPKLVYSSSPSTRFTGGDVEGLREDQMPIPETFVALYAETKAKGEKAVHKACCDELLTISVAPHQVYGPHDSLFLEKVGAVPRFFKRKHLYCIGRHSFFLCF